MRNLWLMGLSVMSAAGVLGCDVESTADDSNGVPGLFGGAGGAEATGGRANTTGGNAPGGASAQGGAGGAEPVQPDPKRGLLVLNGDYTSVSLSVVSKTGEVLSPALISSGSSDPGLSAALAGDTILPVSDLGGTEAVLVDRSNAVVTWVGIESGDVRAQLDVGTGFDSNPHDYVPVADDKAYVVRFAGNLDSGQQPHDEGHDLLVVDPSVPEILGRIDLTPAMDGAGGLPPAAERGVHLDGKVYVLLTAIAADFSDVATARVAVIDVATDSLEETLVLEGMRNCANLSVSPGRDTIAVACNGFFRQDPNDGFPDSGVVLLSPDGGLHEAGRLPADAFQYCDGDCRNVQVNGVAWLDHDTLFASSFGMMGGGPDADINYPALAFQVDVGDDEATQRAEGGAFDLGIPACFFEARCFLPDAGQDGGVLRVFEPGADGALSEGDAVTVDSTTGLPPRHLQRF